MNRKDFTHDVCPVARSLEIIGDTWSMLIVREAFLGIRRFSEFQKRLGVAKNILTVRLRKLVEWNVLEQVPIAEGSGFHEYTLTDKGRGLYIVLMAIRQWGEGCTGAANAVLIDRRDRKPIRPLELISHDGRKLQPSDVELVPADVG